MQTQFLPLRHNMSFSNPRPQEIQSRIMFCLFSIIYSSILAGIQFSSGLKSLNNHSNTQTHTHTPLRLFHVSHFNLNSIKIIVYCVKGEWRNVAQKHHHVLLYVYISNFEMQLRRKQVILIRDGLWHKIQVCTTGCLYLYLYVRK